MSSAQAVLRSAHCIAELNYQPEPAGKKRSSSQIEEVAKCVRSPLSFTQSVCGCD